MFEQIRTYIYGQGFRSSDAAARRADGGLVASDGQTRFLADAIDPDSPRLNDRFDDSEKAAIGTQHVERQFELEPDELRALIDEYETAGISQSEFIAAQASSPNRSSKARSSSFGTNSAGCTGRYRLRRGGAPRRAGNDTVSLPGRCRCVHRLCGGQCSGTGLDYHSVLHHIGTPLFILDTNGDILSWNRSIENLTGVSEAEAKEMEMASMAFYPDGRRGKTLADKVLDAPETTHTEYDVPKVEDEEFTLYRDTSVMADQHGNERHISFIAAPIYDDDGELIAVVEMVQDRTDEPTATRP